MKTLSNQKSIVPFSVIKGGLFLYDRIDLKNIASKTEISLFENPIEYEHMMVDVKKVSSDRNIMEYSFKLIDADLNITVFGLNGDELPVVTHDGNLQVLDTHDHKTILIVIESNTPLHKSCLEIQRSSNYENLDRISA